MVKTIFILHGIAALLPWNMLINADSVCIDRSNRCNMNSLRIFMISVLCRLQVESQSNDNDRLYEGGMESIGLVQSNIVRNK